jgi:hypothetical protein
MSIQTNATVVVPSANTLVYSVSVADSGKIIVLPPAVGAASTINLPDPTGKVGLHYTFICPVANAVQAINIVSPAGFHIGALNVTGGLLYAVVADGRTTVRIAAAAANSSCLVDCWSNGIGWNTTGQCATAVGLLFA